MAVEYNNNKNDKFVDQVLDKKLEVLWSQKYNFFLFDYELS